MNLRTAFENLAMAHGNHSAVAIFLGYTVEHYRALRNGRVNIPQRTADYIILKASELEPGPEPASGSAPPTPEARP